MYVQLLMCSDRYLVVINTGHREQLCPGLPVILISVCVYSSNLPTPEVGMFIMPTVVSSSPQLSWILNASFMDTFGLVTEESTWTATCSLDP